MNKRDAFKVLVENTLLLTESQKSNILRKADEFSEEELSTIGKMLAHDIKRSKEVYPGLIKDLEELQTMIDSESTDE